MKLDPRRRCGVNKVVGPLRLGPDRKMRVRYSFRLIILMTIVRAD